MPLATCEGCELADQGRGFAHPSGPAHSPFFFLGEALGAQEAEAGIPFVGGAGYLLNRVLEKAKLPRPTLRVGNVVSCQPPRNWLEGAPWEQAAVSECRSRYLQPRIEEWLASSIEGVGAGIEGTIPEKVMVTLGGVPLRSMLDLPRRKGVRVQDFHGSVNRSPCGRFWIVPTYHPSHIQRGAFNLMGVFRYDLQRALQVSRQGWSPERTDLFVDPDLDWFRNWAEEYLAAVAQDPWGIWLAIDIETPEKTKKADEGELKIADRDYQITRVNLSFDRREGVTVPYSGPYIDIIGRMLSTPSPHIFWNANYDVPRLMYHKHTIGQPIWDMMWGWHVLQSDLPRGLGFVSQFYSDFGPWKHLSDSDPGRYAAIDAVQTFRCALGIHAELDRQSMWPIFERHVWKLDTLVLHPAEDVGLAVDRPGLEAFTKECEEQEARLDTDIAPLINDAVRPLTKATPRPPKKLKEGEELVERTELVEVRCCLTCGAVEVTPKHRCKVQWHHLEGGLCTDKKTCGVKGRGSHVKVKPEPELELRDLNLRRFRRRKPFNPGSPTQVLALIYQQKELPGRSKKTDRPSADKETLERLARKGKSPVWGKLLSRRQVDKIRGTYGEGLLNRLKEDWRSRLDGRIHPTFLHKPSTLRLSCQAPNLQNIIARGPNRILIEAFRRCIVAEEGCVLLEVDYAGIEAVLTGWFCRDPQYIRLAKLGVHAFVACALLGIPVDLSQSDEQLKALFSEVKENNKYVYNQCKRCVHGTNYGLTVRGMVLQFPDEFPTIAAAQRVHDIYMRVAPSLPRWQGQTREQAHKDSRIGGKSHPYGYRHWFFNVINYRPLKAGRIAPGTEVVTIGGAKYALVQGEDAKRAVAFYPQSTAAGVIKEAMLRLFDPEHESYIGDTFHGRTPLRAQIHDSLLLEVPREKFEYVYERVIREMRRPIPQLWCPKEWGIGEEIPELGDGERYLTIGTEAKVGTNWGEWNDKPPVKPTDIAINLQGMRTVTSPTLATDIDMPTDEYDEEDTDLTTPDQSAVM